MPRAPASIAAVLLLGACSRPAPAPDAPPPPAVATAPVPEGDKVAAEVTITETTVADLAGLRLGVGNVWDDDFTGPDGRPTRGPTAMLAISDEAGKTLHRERVHAGSEVSAGGHRFRIQSVHAPENGLGSVTVAELATPGGP